MAARGKCWRLVLGLAVLWLLAGCSREVLYARLDERQANDVVAALLGSGIDAEKRPAERGDGWQVLTDRRDLPNAVAVLRDAGLPRQGAADLGQLFKKDGFVSSPIEDKQRYIYAREQELDNTLRQIDGVVDAYVHLSIPDKDPLSDKAPNGAASVVVISRPNAAVEGRAPEIKSVVMNGVEGLGDASRVTVQFFQRAPTELAAVPARPLGGMRGDVASFGLVAFAVLAVGLAAGLLWRNRHSLLARQPRDLNRRGGAG